MKDKALVYGKYFKTFFNYKNLLIYKSGEEENTYRARSRIRNIYYI